MNLSELVPSLKRTLAVPGTFATLFPNTTDIDLEDTLADAVAEAKLDGFLSTVSLDVVNAATTPDLSTAEQALVVLYGMSRVLVARVANLKNRTRYKAGSAEAETEQSASILVELLREVRDRKKQLLDDARTGRAGADFTMLDLYVSRSIDVSSPDMAYLFPLLGPGPYSNELRP